MARSNTRRLTHPSRTLAWGCLLGLVVGCQKSPSDVGVVPNPTAGVTAATPRDPMSDADIAQAITRHFSNEGPLRSEHLAVTVSHGIATLAGSVGNVLAKRRALDVAETIRGVRAVVDGVTVRSVTRSDVELAADVTRALHKDVATRARTLGVTARDGVVTLSGVADSWQERSMFAQIVEDVPGVTSVDNTVVPHVVAIRPSAEIAADVRHRLANDVWLDGNTLTVAVVGRSVRVSGFVGSVAQKRRANYDEWVAGVDDVDDDGILVDWAAQNDQRRVGDSPLRSDDDVARAVRDAFALDPRLRTLVPQVTVEHGLVVLSGTVDSAEARRHAEADARDTVGAWGVHDDVLVALGVNRTDADIEREAKQQLMGDAAVPDASAIEVTSTKGVVVLSGGVAAAFERSQAAADVADVEGVSEIDDQLVVTRLPLEIQADIEERLFWDPLVERNAVTVAVAPDGTATLTGTLTTWGELKAADDDAKAAGPSRVVDNLKLNNHPDFEARQVSFVRAYASP